MKTLASVMFVVLLPLGVRAAQTDAAKVATGQKAFVAAKCSTCHSLKGQGGKLATALDGVGGKLSEADLKTWLTDPATMEAKLPKKPVMSMAGYIKSQKLTDAQVASLVAYLLSLK